MNDNEFILKGIRNIKIGYEKTFDNLVEKYGINQIQIDIMLFLYNNPGYDTAQSMCDMRGLAKSNVSTAVEALCRKGWIERKTDNENRRIIHLKITKKAKDFVDEASEKQNSFFEKMFSDFSADQKKQARQMMNMIFNTLDNSEEK